ncbi:MAG: SufD family Fe-S cluster assembly protein, partial [Bacteroidota bacterium]
MSTQTIDPQAVAFFSRFQPVKVNGKSLARATREEAAEALAQMAIPTRKWEDWKYTNLAPLVKRDLSLAPKGKVSAEEVQSLLVPELDADYLVFVNGYFEPELSQFSAVNYHINSLHNLEGMEREMFEAYFGQIVAYDQDVFTAMNTAYGAEGLFVYVPKAKMIEKPLQILHITQGEGNDLGVQHRNMFIVGEGASIKIIESYHTLGQATSFRNDVTEIKVEDRAQIEHIRLQIAGNEASQVNNLEVHQGKDSIAKTFVFTMSGDLIRNNLIFKLKDEHTESHLMGAYLLDGNQKLDNFTQVNHMKPHCYSNELYKGIL